MFDVKKCLSKYTMLCNEALETQTTLLKIPMLDPEHDKQQHWLAQKIEEINKFENDVKKWLSGAAAKKDDENLDVLSIINSDIRPEDSISNVSSKGSKPKDNSSVHSKASSIIYVHKAKAERAALLQSEAALRKLHDIDAEEEALQMEKAKLKRKKQQLEVEAKSAAATARLSMFENVCGVEDVDEYEENNGEDSMNAYLHAHLKSQTSSYLNIAPVLQLSKTVSFQQDHSQPLAVQPKGRLHIPQAQSSVRSGYPLSSVSYAPSSDRSEVQGNILGTRPTNAAPAGLQLLISQGSRLSVFLRDCCKGTSNSSEVLASIPEPRHSKTTRGLNLDQMASPVETALGLHWCIDADVLTFRIAIEERPHTRRGILSVVSSIYDPLGFLAPFTLPVKRMLQKMCRLNIGWGASIPRVFSEQWSKWLANLHHITELTVDRCIKPKDFGTPTHLQLHHFSDASEYGYGTASYLRMENERNHVSIAFILGKARVTPLKQTTVPRLELTAAVLAVWVDKLLKRELQLDLHPSVFWIDSTTVLKYIGNETRRFHMFVANRVAVIRN